MLLLSRDVTVLVSPARATDQTFVPRALQYRNREVLDSIQRLSELIKQRRVDEPLHRELVLVKPGQVLVRNKHGQMV